MRPEVQHQHTIPLPLDFNVLAITDDGTIVNRKNIMQYMNRECLTI